MDYLLGFLNVVIVILTLFLIVLILIQRGKGGGLAGAFGGMGGSSAFGADRRRVHQGHRRRGRCLDSAFDAHGGAHQSQAPVRLERPGRRGGVGSGFRPPPPPATPKRNPRI